jgi:hypothetical protein
MKAGWWLDGPKPGAVPAFSFRDWKSGVIAKLPAPNAPFGLDLVSTRVTDGGLKELAPLKNLTTLKLRETKVTDVGVAELRKALPNCKVSR